MEIRVTVGNKTWVVPAGSINALIAWLSVNAVELGSRQEVREVVSNNNDGRQLLGG